MGDRPREFRPEANQVQTAESGGLDDEVMNSADAGYSFCPLITGIGKVILAEFGYDGKLLPSFPLGPRKEMRRYWMLMKDLLPPTYWHGIQRGCSDGQGA